MEKHLAGTLEYGTNATLGLKGGFVSMSESKLLSADVVKVIDQAKEDIISGKIKVGTAFGADQATLDAYVAGTWMNK